MIKDTKGNLLKAPVEALVNTINTKGIMGKGIALQFRQAYPEMFKLYAKRCKSEEVTLGTMDIHDLGGLVGGPQWIINFPTKGHWRSRSRIEDVKAGLSDLVAIIKKLQITSIAVPPLGCGNGGLPWAQIRPLIEDAFSQIPEVEVLLYSPMETPTAKSMPVKTARPKMTPGQAALIKLIDRYLRGMLDPVLTLLEVHKLMYFLQSAGEPLRLQFEKRQRGPYAKNLRHVLIRMESHYTSGYGDGQDKPDTVIELLPNARSSADKLLIQGSEISTRLLRVEELICGYEDSYGMELLSSMHWVMNENEEARINQAQAVEGVLSWNTQKRKLLKPEHLKKAWTRLRELNWV